ncbi:winged helix-turn-helix transcriptional regulator [Roseibium suaedae]|nr:helix-turn-helix domain-containing protein [Roseibium suaedae]
MVLLDVLGQRWTLRILWELTQGPATFRELQKRCDGISPTLVNRRLAQFRDLGFVAKGKQGYELTQLGQELSEQFISLESWANRWAEEWAQEMPEA